MGLTGGIAAGKSIVAQRMAECGAVLIDADVLARKVLAAGTEGLAEVRQRFGDEVIAEDGSLDRSALSDVVFNDEQALRDLNRIVHPRVRAESARRRNAAPHGSIVVEDIPLLVETGQQDRFDAVVVVQAPAQERMRRMVSDRGMSQEEAEARIAAQTSDADRAEAATVVLDNAGTEEELVAKVDELMVNLTAQQRHQE